ncbi:MAG: DUF6176 family protein [bacterium]|nr:hypothetical protein [bacterium]MBU1918843.1 hypothetical protein [bacterium]
MQYILTKLQIKPGKTEETKNFLKTLETDRHPEMMEAFSETGMFFEVSFIENKPEGDVLYIFKKLHSLEELKKKIENSKQPIFDSIRIWAKECLVGERLDIEAVTVYESK